MKTKSTRGLRPGYVYFIEAQGFHGIIPGLWVKRCKIGVSIAPDERVDKFESSQPPCDFKVRKIIKVPDMFNVEGELHDLYQVNHVILKRSKEWYDFNLLELRQVEKKYDTYLDNKMTQMKKILAASAVCLGILFIAEVFKGCNNLNLPTPSLQVQILQKSNQAIAKGTRKIFIKRGIIKRVTPAK